MLSIMKVSEAPFYVAMCEHNELASHRALNFGHLDKKSWVLFGRELHPPLYDSVMRVAEGHKVRPRDLCHIMVPEEAFEFIAERNGLALLTKTGALRIARDGVTLRPTTHAALEAGYTTPSAIIAAFRKALGSTPAQYFKEPSRA
jgi:AraC-like DNA-binding protein